MIPFKYMPALLYCMYGHNRVPYFSTFVLEFSYFHPIVVPDVSSLEFDGEADMDVSMNTLESKQF